MRKTEDEKLRLLTDETEEVANIQRKLEEEPKKVTTRQGKM